MSTVHEAREDLVRHFYPDGMPNLWCPALSHFDEGGNLDEARMKPYLRRVADFSTGWLLFGPTGDGESLSNQQIVDSLPTACRLAKMNSSFACIGAFASTAAATIDRINAIVNYVQESAAADGEETTPGMAPLFASRNLLGIATHPPSSVSSPDKVFEVLQTYLDIGVPTLICQSTRPHNQLTPEFAVKLAENNANFVMFEDATSEDRIAASSANLGSVYKFRGADGDYVRWTKSMGGPYYGFMPGAANHFGMQLAEGMEFLNEGFATHAVNVITPVQRTITAVQRAVAALPFGDRRANAAKAIDHFLAFGRTAKTILRTGDDEIPADVMTNVREAIEQGGFLPASGYMA